MSDTESAPLDIEGVAQEVEVVNSLLPDKSKQTYKENFNIGV